MKNKVGRVVPVSLRPGVDEDIRRVLEDLPPEVDRSSFIKASIRSFIKQGRVFVLGYVVKLNSGEF